MIDKFSKEKAEIEKIIEERGWETIRVVLFDTTNRVPFAIHLFEKDGKYLIQTSGERGSLDGNPGIFDNFESAKAEFIKQMELEIRASIYDVEKWGYSDYPSPLWDKYAIQLVTDTIDAIGVVDGALELLLADPNHWFVKDEQDHLFKLQEKINNYIHFIETKQYVEKYGDNFDKKVINITFQYAPSDNGLAFLAQVQKVLQSTDMSLKVVLPE
ncbi:Imm59 family immunity protein [Streptococcus caballi]|uniref:Imm59 family immunity protein n=1 Tax=Streptococcus caballi TaxID=439220 RepID=UPI000379F3B1|nr:Imm59 family immunity protein [Streptococcus caballi]